MPFSLIDPHDTHDMALFGLAIIMAAIACGGSGALTWLAQEADGARRRKIRALAGACFGGGAWATHVLTLLAFQPAVMFSFNLGLMFAAGLCAIAGAALAFMRYGETSRRAWFIRASGVLSLSLFAMHLCTVSAIDAAARVHWSLAAVILTFAVPVAGFWLGARYIENLPRMDRRLGKALASAITMLSFSYVGANSFDLQFDPSLPGSASNLAPLIVAFIISIVAIGLLASALGYVIIDRHMAIVKLMAQSRASKLADAALEGLIVHDGETVLEANARFSWIAGDGTEAVQGHALRDFFSDEAVVAIHQAMSGAAEGQFETVLSSGAEVELHTRLYDKDAGQYVTAVRDLSMRKRVDSAEKANLAKSQFLANMSHELRTPLNAIIGYSEMIIEDSGDNEAIRDARQIHDAAKNMLSLVNDIVDLSRIEDGKIEFCFDHCDVEEMSDRLRRRFQAAAQAKGLMLTFDIDPSSGEAVVDEKRVEQCVAQLLSNAVKFTDHGSIGVRFWTSHDEFHVEVKDTGIGMHPKRAEQLFEAFSQGDGSITRRYGGVGVGLALTSRLTALMGGCLELLTAEGKGAIVTLIAPSDPDPDILALRRKTGGQTSIVSIIDIGQSKAA